MRLLWKKTTDSLNYIFCCLLKKHAFRKIRVGKNPPTGSQVTTSSQFLNIFCWFFLCIDIIQSFLTPHTLEEIVLESSGEGDLCKQICYSICLKSNSRKHFETKGVTVNKIEHIFERRYRYSFKMSPFATSQLSTFRIMI